MGGPIAIRLDEGCWPPDQAIPLAPASSRPTSKIPSVAPLRNAVGVRRPRILPSLPQKPYFPGETLERDIMRTRRPSQLNEKPQAKLTAGAVSADTFSSDARLVAMQLVSSPA